jgi:hypothetical protein
LNSALDGLVSVGIVRRDDHCIALDPDVHHLLAEIANAVRRGRSARAMRRARTGHRRTGTPRQTTDARSRHPKRGTSEWGRWMRAKLGGLTVQRLYRKFGVHPTAPATAARIAKRAQREQPVPASTPVTRRAPAAQPTTTASRGEAWFPSGIAAGRSAGIEYSQPIGRRERLAAERNRR